MRFMSWQYYTRVSISSLRLKILLHKREIKLQAPKVDLDAIATNQLAVVLCFKLVIEMALGHKAGVGA